MSDLADTTPVIIGVGQYAERPDDSDYKALSAMDLGGEALAAAIADTAATGDVADAIDTIAAIRQFEISVPNAVAPFGKSNNVPRSYGKRVGADPARAILEIVGGQGPQKLVGELATDIAEGRSSVGAIVGSEAISTVLALSKKGEKPDWSEEIDGELEDRGFGMRGLLDSTLIAHGLATPISLYALFDNARRAERGMNLADYRLEIGELFAPFSEVAANNPYAAAPVARTAEELATVTERNRIVAEPYTRMTVARDQVNQAAAIVIASVGKARELGIPEDRWVHIHAVTDAKELSVLERPDMAKSAASIASVGDALDMAGVDMAAMTYLDLYSCFAIAVTNISEAFDIAPDDPRGLTLTGGLPFFGGAGNNYSGHAIVEAIQKLRDDATGYALVGANGGFMSKYSTGIYSRQPADWSNGRFKTLPGRDDTLEVRDSHSGPAVIDSYTIVPGRKATVAAIVARTDDGARIVANPAEDDSETMAILEAGEPVGRSVSVRSDEGRNIFSFS
ncbi:acetyl-CoA acetyltransferase [Parasphingopyxis sp. CP4]|uniref:acetyl-CoA acetyltransferase n=1 Tax=Parasphingopyxis sp. CP4 TaxID=2724527 RepID=UPI0015A30A4D|nr:acetyl-CoA acetyltransferase [Parasphingopyxis sp. CP4]QLC23111.1 acetyl-CoA acetyltransferase [Parasphingopyxis sp. CP4]